MKNNLTTTQKTEVVLAKGKSLLGITAKILSGSKALSTAKSKELTHSHEYITTIDDLMWQDEPYTQEEQMANFDYYTHGKAIQDGESAIAYAKTLRLGEYDDWRLPTKEEILELLNDTEQSMHVVFGNYWSSNTVVGGENFAWNVYLNYDGSRRVTKTDSGYVRCVRAGQ